MSTGFPARQAEWSEQWQTDVPGGDARRVAGGHTQGWRAPWSPSVTTPVNMNASNPYVSRMRPLHHTLGSCRKLSDCQRGRSLRLQLLAKRERSIRPLVYLLHKLLQAW